MVKLAEHLLDHNRLTGSIRLHAKRSDELSVSTYNLAASKPSSQAPAQASHPNQHPIQAGSTLTSAAAKRMKHARQQEDYAAGNSSSMPCKADIIVTEIFDSELIGEGILPTMRHAVKHLLKPDGIVIPATAVVYGQLVECPVLAAQSHPSGWPSSTHVKTKPMRGQSESSTMHSSSFRQTSGPATVQMHAAHVDPLYPEHVRVLCEPFEVFRFDFAKPPERDGAQHLQVQATAVGTAHAVIVWWQLNLDSSELITLDTAPCWVAKQPLVTAPQSSQVPQTGPLPQSGPQLVPAPGAEPLHAKEQTSHASHQSQLVGPTQSSSQAGSSGLSCSMQSPLAETAPAATAAAAAASFASVALPEDCLGHGQACRPEPGQWQQSQQPQQHQQQQQWRDHWKQCWTPVQAPFGLDQGTCFQMDAHHDGTSISITAFLPSPSQHHKDTRLADQQTPHRQEQSCQKPSASVSQTQQQHQQQQQQQQQQQRHQQQQQQQQQQQSQDQPHDVPRSSECLQHLTDTTVPSQPASHNSASQEGPKSFSPIGSGSASARTAEPGASPNRRWMLSDAGRALQYERAVQSVVGRAGPRAVCIVSGGSAHLAVAAAACATVDQVICLQENASQQRYVLQAAQAAGLSDKIAVADAQQVLGCDDPAACLAELTAAPAPAADVFLSEPFYAALESWPPWFQLRSTLLPLISHVHSRNEASECNARELCAQERCWHERDVLLAAGLLKPDHMMMPCAGRLCGVGVTLPDLWRTRAPVGVVHGVDLSPCNAVLGALEGSAEPCRSSCLSQTTPVLTKSIWQCGSGYSELTERITLLDLDFATPFSSLQAQSTARVVRGGIMHALVTWTEFQLTSDSDQWLVRRFLSGLAALDHTSGDVAFDMVLSR
ncbi:Protein arginine N-methyltransferase 7 [Trebouxia sp. C0010 RCD-2024]